MFFLAPVPIIHIQAMLEDTKRGHACFAFGSNSIEFFDKNIVRECASENIPAYIYCSQTGLEQIKKAENFSLGIYIKGRLSGWIMGDNRGQYPKSGIARRPSSAINDGPMSLFWEIDNIEVLPERLSITDFVGSGSKPFSEDFVPQGPMLVTRRI